MPANLCRTWGRGQGMTFEVEQKLRPELGRDERLLWSGMPKQGLRLRSQDWFVVPFTLLWCYLVMFGDTHHHGSTNQTPLYLTPFGIPFVAVGLYMLVGRFFTDWYQRTRTYYGVTDQHVLILDGLFNRQVKSLPLATLDGISLTERSDRSGSIAFGPNASNNTWFFRSSRYNQQPPSFDMIEDARKVYALIRDTQQASRRAAS